MSAPRPERLSPEQASTSSPEDERGEGDDPEAEEEAIRLLLLG